MAGTIIADTLEHSDSTSLATNQLAAKNAAQTFSAAQTFTAQSVHNGGIDCNGAVDIDANVDVAGALNIDGQYKQVSEAVSASAIDLSTGNYFEKTVSGNTTFTFTNPPASGTVGSFTLKIVHSSGTITWPSSVKFPADTAPTLATGKTHVFVFQTTDGGSRYQGISAVDFVN